MNRLLAIMFIFVFASAICAQSICPSISVTGPSGIINRGETAVYFGSIDTKGNQFRPKYIWSVSAGKILKGQGTLQLEVEQPDTSLVVTLTVKGLPEGCSNTASEWASRDPAPSARKVLEVPETAPGLDYAELDKIVTALKNEPNRQLYVLIGRNKPGGSAVIALKEKQATDYLIQQGIDKAQITLKHVDAKVELMQFWLVPPGAENPRCKECEELSRLENKQDCSTISLIGPTGRVRAGDQIIISVDVGRNDLKNVIYNWTISAGNITSGANTPSIAIETGVEAMPVAKILAKVEITGLRAGCQNTASKEFIIDSGIRDPLHVDEYDNMSFDKEKARLDDFAKQVLSANRTTGYIIKSFSKNVPPAIQKGRIRELKRFLFEIRKYPKGRFVILLGVSGHSSTKLYIVPPEPVLVNSPDTFGSGAIRRASHLYRRRF